MNRAVTLLKRYSTAQPAPAPAPVAAASPRAISATASDQLDDLLSDMSAPAPALAKAKPVAAAVVRSQDNDDLDSLLGQLTQQHAPAKPREPPIAHAHAPDPNPPAVGLRIAPGRSQGQAAVHKAQVEADMWYGKTREWNKAKLPPQAGFNPVPGEVVQYTFLDRDQLEADIQHLKNLMSAGEIDNATFQAQRDHMLIQARGGPQYGAVFSGDHPNVTGRAKGASDGFCTNSGRFTNCCCCCCCQIR